MTGCGGCITLCFGVIEYLASKQVAWVVERFGRYLASVGVIPTPWFVAMPILNRQATTPLRETLTPDRVLEAAKGVANPYRLALLVGYFGGLRPGEVFALEKADFITGDAARSGALTYQRFKQVGLGSGLAVRVNKALSNAGVVGVPKTKHSYGIVSIWDNKAARMIADLLRDHPDGRLFQGHKTHLFKTFKQEVTTYLGVTAHDLRRASALYLGRTVGIEVMLLQDHMRHSDIQTTMLYTRRPLTDLTESKQDFDDVG